MHYHRIIIENYRAITGPLEIDLRGHRLLPVIGVNECGKTTILHAILAFDFVNDTLNQERHLEDTQNLYEVDPDVPKISADIKLTRAEFKRAVSAVAQSEEWKGNKALAHYKRKTSPLPEVLRITRSLDSKLYSFDLEGYNYSALNDEVAREIVASLPYILYFDDFTGSIEEKVEINSSSESEWLQILDTLFKKTDKSYSVMDLPQKEERIRKTMLSKVRRKLEATLTQEWRSFRLDDTDALTVSLDYKEEGTGDDTRSYVTFEIVERDAKGDEHYFFVRDRSKGFFWFFNFVMKLEFNPKVINGAGPDAIYLLDEPGSYLHSVAQEKLCAKLRALSNDNHVIFCTHSHHLLNPEQIPLSTVRIAEKNPSGQVSLVSIYDHKGTITERRSAYQPILDALQVRPFQMDLVSSAPVLLVEGIIDYYAYLMFANTTHVTVVPCVGAPSIKFYISLMIAWGLTYRALWDNDPAGRAGLKDAKEYFGDVEAERSFRVLPGNGKRIIQNLLDGEDLRMFKKHLDLPANTGFDKVLTSLFYSSERESILKNLSTRTKANFADLADHLDWDTS